MLYKPISGLVNVGYNKYAERFCWEDESRNCHHAPQTLEHLADALRRLDVEPLQIENTGTEKPYKSKKLSKKELERLKTHLETPFTYVIKLELPKGSPLISIDGSANSKFAEKIRPKIHSTEARSSIFVDYPFLIIRGSEEYRLQLRDIPRVLKKVKVKKDDILFREEKDGRFSLSDYEERYYILLALHRKNKARNFTLKSRK